MKNIALILASGTGKRSGFDIPKQFVKIGGKTVLELSTEAFEKNGRVAVETATVSGKTSRRQNKKV